jgi:hypothetical protein
VTRVESGIVTDRSQIQTPRRPLVDEAYPIQGLHGLDAFLAFDCIWCNTCFSPGSKGVILPICFAVPSRIHSLIPSGIPSTYGALHT